MNRKEKSSDLSGMCAHFFDFLSSFCNGQRLINGFQHVFKMSPTSACHGCPAAKPDTSNSSKYCCFLPFSDTARPCSGSQRHNKYGLQSWSEGVSRLQSQQTGKQSEKVYKQSCCSVAQSYVTLCNPVDCSVPGSPVLHYLLEFAQTHVDSGVDDTIQPSHLLSPPSPPALSLSQHQCLFQ